MICIKCNKRTASKGSKKCVTCRRSPEGRLKDKRYKDQKRKIYKTHKKDQCEDCGFIPKHRCQLDVDHVDGNHHNNDLSNLRTLCANCHRLKTQEKKDWDSKKIPVST